MARLRLVAGPDASGEYELPEEGCVVGRDEGCGLKLSDPRVSRTHARFSRGARSWLVEDLGSSLGTFVEGERIEGLGRLRDGDRIRIGNTTLEFHTDAPAAAPAAPTAPPPEEERAADALRRLPDYEVLEEIGRGAMGRVYRARRRSDRRELALKILAPALADREGYPERLHREARAVAGLDHPRAVRVLDDGEFMGLHYFAMEYLPGGSVQELLDEDPDHRLSPRETLAILQDTARILAHAHKVGIVHRDVKPANLVIDGIGRAKLTDFGIAVDAHARRSTGRAGTPHFMSPEQARGEPATFASDVYSLGATGYTMLAGRTPFPAAKPEELMRAVVEETPTPLRHVAPDAPPALVRVIERAMSKHPGDRYTHGEALARALKGASSGGARASRGEAPIAARQRKDRGVVGPFVAVVVVLAILGAIGWQGYERDWLDELDDRFDAALERERRAAEELEWIGGDRPPPASPTAEPPEDTDLARARAELDALLARREALTGPSENRASLALEFEVFAGRNERHAELAAEARRVAEELLR